MTALVTKVQFARLNGWDPSYVTKLRRQGRLVMEGEGRRARIRVDESLARIAATEGTRDDVARRHAETRKNGAGRAPAPEQEATLPTPPAGAPSGPPDAAAPYLSELDTARHLKVTAEARRVAALADREEMERDRLAGNLIAREDVDAAMKFLGAAVRGQMEVFPDQVAPLVAPVTDLDEVHALLTEQCRQVLTSVAEALERQAAGLAKEEV
ncbi:MAG TPA: hypothetical protein VFP70_09545 [Burkholderiales bacterium]|nr:hypothetical protein [Burkholderiales bacterium]